MGTRDAIWELSKENVQPLKHGRQPAILEKALRMPLNITGEEFAKDRMTDCELNRIEQRKRFEEKIKTCMNTPDPLDVWYRYIRFMEENYPAGSEKDLRRIIDMCLSCFKDAEAYMQRYASDSRWLHIWLKFASLSRNVGSVNIYKFMRHHGHCVGLAELYIQWAQELEATEAFEDAVEVYKDGFRQNAQPIALLKQSYNEFQTRYSRHLFEKTEIQDDEEPTRNILGVLKGVPGKGNQLKAPVVRLSEKEPVRCGKSLEVKKDNMINIFNEADNDSLKIASLRPGLSEKTTATPSLPIESETCKENIRNAGVWTKAKLNQGLPKSVSTRRHPFVEIYLDDMEKNSQKADVLVQPTSAKAGGSSSKPAKTQCQDAKETMVCCMDKIYGSVEMSFEELRALTWKPKPSTSARSSVLPSSNVSSSVAATESRRPASRQNPTSATSGTNNAPTDEPSWMAGNLPGNSSFTQKIYRETMAAFSTTLPLNADNEAHTESYTDSSVVVGRSKPPGQQANNFICYEDSIADAGMAPYSVPVYEDLNENKENIMPGNENQPMTKRQPRRTVAGVLVPSSHFPSTEAGYAEDPIFVDGDDGTFYDQPDDSPWDANEPTVAGIHRFLPTANQRMASTPFGQSQAQPVFTEDITAFISKPKASQGHKLDEKTSTEKSNAGTYVVSEVVEQFAHTEKKLSTIVENSRELEYRSSSCSSAYSITASHGKILANNLRGRIPTAGLMGYEMPSIAEQVNGSSRASNDDALCERNKGTASWSCNKSVEKIAPFTLNDDADETVDYIRSDNVSNAYLVNPFEPAFVARQLIQVRQHLETRPNFHTLDYEMPHVKLGGIVNLDGEKFKISTMVGEGAFAKVFRCSSEGNDDLIQKVQSPACIWEFYICEEVQSRLKAKKALQSMLPAFISLRDAYIFTNGSIFIADYCSCGTLLDLTNLYKTDLNKQGLPESIVAYITLDIIRILDVLHQQNIIHGDIKPDNFLVLSIPSTSDESCATPCVRLIDFGRSIDLALLPANVKFIGNAGTNRFDCCEMQEGRPWTFQTDLFGMVGTIHLLAMGSYMNTYKVKGTQKWRSTASFKRRWNTTLWNDFFDTFLNVPSCESIPSLSHWSDKFDRFVQSLRKTLRHQWKTDVEEMEKMMSNLLIKFKRC